MWRTSCAAARTLFNDGDYTKNGGSGGGASRSMMYPGDVQVFITRNSTGNPAEPDSTAMLRAAWEAALV